MQPIRQMLVAWLMAMLGGAAMAQAGAGANKDAGPAAQVPGPASNAPGIAPGRHAGRGPARAGMDYTPGWSLMTRKEREEHRQRMRSMQTYEECKTYMDQHHEQMVARAKEKGGKALRQPRRDACVGLKP
jgi:hypothetical protein